MSRSSHSAGPRKPGEWQNLEPEVQEALARQVEVELARRSFSGALVYFAFSILLAVSTPYYTQYPSVIRTVSALTLLSGVTRILAARRILHGSANLRLFSAAVVATMLVWGLFCAATLQLYPVDWTAMFTMLSTAALAGGASSSLAPALGLAAWSLILLVGPSIVSALMLGGRRHLALAAGAAMYLAYLLAQLKNNWHAFWRVNVAAERERLRNSEERRRTETERAALASAIEQAAEEIVITDAAGRLQYCNPSFERVSGYSRGEVIGQNLRFLKSGKHTPEFYTGVWTTIAGGRVWSGRFTNRRKDGSLYEADCNIAPIYDHANALSGFVSASRDVTERLRLESQLAQAQKLESIGLLAGGVAHDFNNLLTVIIGYSRLLLDGPAVTAEPYRRQLEEIRHAAERAASLTKQLLSFSRKQILMPRPVALDALVAKMQPILQRLVGEDVAVVAVTSPGLGQVRADPDQVSQILMNLAANARDAMPNGGRLTIRTGNATHPAMPGAAVMLAVSDTGMGMDDETRQRIFEPFFTTKERGRGTGLGLATVYGIVQQSEGLVEVVSERGSGSTFEIYLPSIGPPVAAPAIEQKLQSDTGTETVLVVEDQDDVRNLVTTVLGSLGYRVLDAGNGRSALSLAADFPGQIDLLMTDVVMPDITGKQVAEELVRARPGIKVLYMSGYSGTVLADRGVLDTGMAYLAKPFTVEALAGKVREVLGPAAGGVPLKA